MTPGGNVLLVERRFGGTVQRPGALADTWLALGELDYNFGGQSQRQEMLEAWGKNAELREGLAHDRPDDLERTRELQIALAKIREAVGSLS